MTRRPVTGVLVTGRLQPSGLPYDSGCTHGFTLLALLRLGAALAALLVLVRRSARPSEPAARPAPTPAPARVR